MSEPLNHLFEEKSAEERALHSDQELSEWLAERNRDAAVALSLISLGECTPWYYDEREGCIRNRDGSFFKVFGLRQYDDSGTVCEQPVIVQDEIGFLGILSCKIFGTWHYLMQAKIEPGNVNVVQLSPTLQATKSNFTRRHGGRTPKYLEEFINLSPKQIIVDQIQSEQSSRFLKKRNRNVIAVVDEAMEEGESHRWMTLGQIKQMMKRNNLVNMDTRTVLSCIPYSLMGQESDAPFRNRPYFYNTAWKLDRGTVVELYHTINDFKMYSGIQKEKIPLKELREWRFEEDTICCAREWPYRIVFCDIHIADREVTHWRQPLFASNGKAVFGLVCCDDGGVLKFLVKPRAEIGCFDGMEIGPTIQHECGSPWSQDSVEQLFKKRLAQGDGIVTDTILSEEGGRFYHEENRNIIMQIGKRDLAELPVGYVWSEYGTLNMLTQVNNCLNIQLRNLLSLLEV